MKLHRIKVYLRGTELLSWFSLEKNYDIVIESYVLPRNYWFAYENPVNFPILSASLKQIINYKAISSKFDTNLFVLK